jgi:hypothetical protein
VKITLNVFYLIKPFLAFEMKMGQCWCGANKQLNYCRNAAYISDHIKQQRWKVTIFAADDVALKRRVKPKQRASVVKTKYKFILAF